MFDLPPAFVEYIEMYKLNPDHFHYYCKQDDKDVYYYKDPETYGRFSGLSPIFIYSKNGSHVLWSNSNEYLSIHKYCNSINQKSKQHLHIQN